MQILILEDDLDRREAMQSRLADRFPCYKVEFFNAVMPMIARLEATTLQNVIAISLDHDLEMLPDSDGAWVDPGTGVEFAKWLAQQMPSCPVLIHTTNSQGGGKMAALLTEANWKTMRVVPYEGNTWIDEQWFPTLRKVIVESAAYLGELKAGESSQKRKAAGREFPRLNVELPSALDVPRRPELT